MRLLGIKVFAHYYFSIKPIVVLYHIYQINSFTMQYDEDLDPTSQVYQDNNENIMIQRTTD